MKLLEVSRGIQDYVKGNLTQSQSSPFLYLSKICGEISLGEGAALYAIRPRVSAYLDYLREEFSVSNIVHNLEKERFHLNRLLEYFETPYFRSSIFKSLNILFRGT